MIFITKKAFENEMYNRINEQNFKGRIEDELDKLKDTVRELQYKVEMLEQSIRQPVPVNPATGTNPHTYEPAPYLMNPNFKMPEVTCASPYQTTCTTSNEVKAE